MHVTGLICEHIKKPYVIKIFARGSSIAEAGQGVLEGGLSKRSTLIHFLISVALASCERAELRDTKAWEDTNHSQT